MSVKTPPSELAKAKGIISLAGEMPAVLHIARIIGRRSATVPVLLTKAATTAVTSMTKLNALLDKDTGEMTEKELDDYADSVKWAWADTAGQLMMLVGVPYNNGKKYVQAVFAWMDTVKQWDETG